MNERRKARALARMNDALREVYEELGKRIVAADVEDARRRYDIGVLVRSVSDTATYGTKAVMLLAAALGQDKDSLYEAARVATCWTRRELEAILARPTRHRRSLSFSHLALLAGITNTAKRDEYLEACLKLGLSVRHLERLVKGRAARVRGSQPARVVKSFIAQARAGQKLLAELDPRVVVTGETRALLEAAVAEHRLFLSRLEAAVALAAKNAGPRERKVAKGQPDSEKFGTFRKSVSALWGGPPDGEE